MKKIISFNCEVITPMFMYGGDSKTLELRPSEFKGMLRFWWRALHPDLSLKNLKEREAEIFGETDKKSSFRLKVKLIKEYTDFNRHLQQAENIGLNYLFYSMFLGVNKNKSYFRPGTQFRIEFIFSNLKYIKDILNVFWCLTFLGALGSRNRRGAGNFKILNYDEKNELLEDCGLNFIIDNVNDIDKFKIFLIENLNKILPKKSNNNSYTNLSNFRLFLYNKIFPTWLDALNDIGERFRNFRTRKSPDYSTVKNFILNGSTGDVKRPAFGLPLQFRYRSLGKNKNSATLQGSNENRQRSGSPLFIKIIKLNNKFVPLLLFFEKALLPNNDSIKISSKNQKAKNLNVATLNIINDFLNEISKNIIEVKYNE